MLCTVLGGEMDGRSLVLRPKQSRIGLLRAGLHAIVSGRPVSGRQLEHVVGHLNFVCLSFRLSLSVLCHTYRYLRDCYHIRRPVWDTVRQELKNMRGILPLLQSSISDRICPYVYMFDASMAGYGVMRGKFEDSEIRGALQYRERWRFKYAAQRNETVTARASALKTADVFNDVATVKPLLTGEVKDVLEVDRSFPEIPPHLLDPARYEFAWKHRFRNAEVIHMLEARGLWGVAKQLASYMQNYGAEALVLSDNMSIVLAIDKGRCADFKLLVVLRKLCALCLVSGLRLRVRWIPSESNLADKPSRAFGSANEAFVGVGRHPGGHHGEEQLRRQRAPPGLSDARGHADEKQRGAAFELLRDCGEGRRQHQDEQGRRLSSDRVFAQEARAGGVQADGRDGDAGWSPYGQDDKHLEYDCSEACGSEVWVAAQGGQALEGARGGPSSEQTGQRFGEQGHGGGLLEEAQKLLGVRRRRGPCGWGS